MKRVEEIIKERRREFTRDRVVREMRETFKEDEENGERERVEKA